MRTIIKNKKAFYDYEIIERYLAGIQLQGSEVKSIKNSKTSISEAYCFINKDEIFIKNMHVSEFKEGGKYNNHIPLRDKKLLLTKKEIYKIEDVISKKGLTLIPLELLCSKTGFIKIEIAIARGKNNFDKRESIKVRDLDKEMKKNF